MRKNKITKRKWINYIKGALIWWITWAVIWIIWTVDGLYGSNTFLNFIVNKPGEFYTQCHEGLQCTGAWIIPAIVHGIIFGCLFIWIMRTADTLQSSE